MRVARLIACALAVLLANAATVSAQSDDRGRLEVAAAARWMGPIDFPGRPADETTLGGGTRPLFDSATTLEGSVGGSGLVGLRLSRAFQVEFTFGYNPTSLRTQITSDAEGIRDLAVDAPVTQLLMEGGVVVRPTAWGGGRLVPFLTAGAGYLRQLNDGRTLVETGRSYYVGGGLYYERATAGRRRLKASGIRIDVRGQVLQEGVAPDDTPRVAPAVAAGLFVRF
jgi:hypothetical protein